MDFDPYENHEQDGRWLGPAILWYAAMVLALHDPRLSDLMDAYLAADRLELTGPADDLRDCAESILSAAETLAREFEGAADYLEDVR